MTILRTAANLGMIAALAWLPLACTNNPYREGETAEATYFSTFATPPTKLDPANSYYSHEGQIIGQIYEPPFTYHYLKRPYELAPLTAVSIPEPVYFDAAGAVLSASATGGIARVEYTVHLRRNILYQNHPCFARDVDGKPFHADVTAAELAPYAYPTDLPEQDTREVTAADYVLQIRRLADPRLASPVFSTLAAFIAGLDELQEAYSAQIEAERARRRQAAGAAYNQEQDEKLNPIKLDYMAPPFAGAQRIDSHRYRIVLSRPYPQILYWMCLHFFAPVPHEALTFYAFPGVLAKGWSLNRCPVGSGPYYLETFRPNEIMVLQANPNYHEDTYPTEGDAEDDANGLLADAGKRLPMIKRQVYRMEKEAIPAWHKFLQGYVDASGIASDVFDQAVDMSGLEGATLSPAMRAKGMRLRTDVRTLFWYTGFNMLDDVVGGYTQERAALRQAISIALDYNEFLDIFANGRGVAAQSPIPPGIFGYRPGEAGTNPYTDTWDPVRGKHVRKSIAEAKRLMVEAGYPDGRDANGNPLTLHYDHAAGVDPQFRSTFQWMRDRLALIGIQIKERGTDLSRYRVKRDQGNWQISSGGWLADYPDPENFLFLFYGPNGKVETGGPNMNNYVNPAYDVLFKQMETMTNSAERLAIIDEMVALLQHDAPAVWQYFPVSFTLMHAWYHNVKPHQMTYNTMRYRRIDAKTRVARQEAWNRPRWQPLAIFGGIVVLLTIPAAVKVYRRERKA